MLISKKIIWSEKILERYLNTLRNPTHGGRQEVHFGRGVAQGDRHSAWTKSIKFGFWNSLLFKKDKNHSNWLIGNLDKETQGPVALLQGEELQGWQRVSIQDILSVKHKCTKALPWCYIKLWWCSRPWRAHQWVSWPIASWLSSSALSWATGGASPLLYFPT